ncbi:MAG: ring hydroxylating alpha subunit family protein [Paucimonas sp.]|nr:ring hydroxylating alpha subunit family protein [Paucimonas sp.]
MNSPVDQHILHFQRRAEADDKVAALRKSLNEASHAPGYLYASQEIYALEKELIFMRDWLPIARVEEFPNIGDYRTFRIADEPIIVARDKDMQLQAFANRCAHRGVAVAEGSGNAKEFECPYHGWLYGLDGKLIGAGYMDQAAGFDRSNCRLKQIALREWQGWVFISFSADPMPFEQHIGPYEKELGFLRQDQLKLADKLVVEVNCNWKFPVENLMDNYHSRVLHRKTIGPTMGVERFKGVRTGSLAFTAYYPAKPMNRSGKSLFGMMPQLAQHPGADESFACSAHIAPWMHLFARCDNVHPFIMEPLGVDKVRITCYQLFPEQWQQQPGFREKLEQYNEFTLAVVNEDASVMESLHDAARSPRYEPGRLSRLELGVWNLINYNVDRVLGTGDTRLYTSEDKQG